MKIHQTQTIHTFPDILVLFLQLTLFFFRLPEPRAKNCWNCWYMYSFCIMPEEGYKNKQKYCWRHFINWNFPLLCTLYKGLKDKSQFLVIWKWKQTSVKGQNGVEFFHKSTGHVRFFLALLFAEIANERLKIPTSLLVDLQTSVRRQNGVEFD